MRDAIRVLLLRLFARSHDPRLDEEIHTHIEMLARDFEAKGMTADDAYAAAQREFGPAMQMREVHRAQRRMPFLDSVAQDVQYAFRQLRKNPSFAAIAVVTLGLGIGANATIFDALDRIVLRPLPVADPGRLAAIHVNQAFGVPLLREMNARQTAAEGLFASGQLDIREASLDGRALREAVFVAATGNYFRLLGTQPQFGRFFSETDDAPSAPPVAVISDRFWRREFGGQPSPLGRTVRLNDGVPATIVGVTRPEFYGERLGQIPDVWVPMSVVPSISPIWGLRSAAWLTPMARLPKDASLEQTQERLAVLLNQLMPDFGLMVRGVSDYKLQLAWAPQGLGSLHAEFSTSLWLLMGIVAIVVLIACCNLANLLLARSVARTREIGVRLAIGASRGRIIRQLLTESVIISIFGGVLGLAAARWGSRALVALALAGEKQDFVAGFSWRIAVFTALASIFCTFIFGLVPAIAASHFNLNAALQAAGRTHRGGPSRRSATKSFAVAQLATSMLLVAAASLLVSSFWKLVHQDMGFSRDGILTFDTGLLSTLRIPDVRRPIYERLSAIPGIQSVAFAQGAPLGFVTESSSAAIPGRNAPRSERFHRIDVSPRYFETMGIEIIAGRAINEDDRSGTARVAVLTETAARKIFGSANPVGRLFTDGPEFKSADAIEVVGVAHDIRFSDVREPFEGAIFLPLDQVRLYTTPRWFLRTGPSTGQFIEPVRQAIRDVAPNLQVDRIRPWDEVWRLQVRKERLLAWLSGAFALLAIILASVGIYGVVAYGAQRRVQEIGVRVALGARPHQLRAMLLRDILGVLMLGLSLGAGATVLLGRWIRSMLFGLAPHDPLTLISAAALFTLIVLSAAYLPARRAARLDPVTALRQE